MRSPDTLEEMESKREPASRAAEALRPLPESAILILAVSACRAAYGR